MSVIDEANQIMHHFAPWLTFTRSGNRLCLRGEFGKDGKDVIVREAHVAKHSGALCINYGRMGMGGTMAMAVGQLARWIRGQTRVPTAAWEYWAGPKILLAGDNGEAMYCAIKNSDYGDRKFTCCVLCQSHICGDWWSKDGIVGPCCTYGKCRDGIRLA